MLFIYFSWHIKWVFPQADVSYHDEKIDEDLRISEVLRKYIIPTNDQLPDGHEKLKYYQYATFRGIVVLFKNEMAKDAPLFEELVISKSIKLNLAYKTVIEHPIFYVVLKDHVDAYLECNSDTIDLFKDNLFEKTSQVIPAQKHSIKEIKKETKDNGLSFFDANLLIEDY